MTASEFKLEGECNQCGLCCISLDGSAHCENLVLQGWPGDESATRCGAWDTRWHKMPIRMVNWDGSLAYESTCTVFAEHLKEGGELTLPKECSYKLVQINAPKL